MAPSPLQLRRAHNTLLLQKLLNLRDGASPFTLVLDSLEQSGGRVVEEFARRAKISKSKVVFISFFSFEKEVNPEHDVFISSKNKSLAALHSEVTMQLTESQKTLVIIDTLNPLTNPSLLPGLPNFLSSLLLGPWISLLATYHTDIPLSLSHTPASYLTPPLTTLTYLATAILRIDNFAQTLSRKRAASRSRQPPVYGLAEHREGLLVSLRSSRPSTTKIATQELVLEMEMRRKSGRGVVETFVFSNSSSEKTTPSADLAPKSRPQKFDLVKIMLLDDHPDVLALTAVETANEGADVGMEGLTFNLGLTEKERRDRDEIVLPYFDAQKEGGSSEGGRILYEMGKEDWDDFDEEEDEI